VADTPLRRPADEDGHCEYQGDGFPPFCHDFVTQTTHNRLGALLRDGLPSEERARLLAEGGALAPEPAVALSLQERSRDRRLPPRIVALYESPPRPAPRLG
jgi:hypothetical protein